MEMFNDNKGFGGIIMGVVGLVVFVILVASVVMPTINNANTTYDCLGKTGIMNASCSWPTSTTAMWGILPIVVVASLILYVVAQKQ